MISLKDLNPKGFETSEDQLKNLGILAEKLSVVEEKSGIQLHITSGLRDLKDHLRIYKEKGVSNPPMGSKHLFGEAADCFDPQKKLQQWCLSEQGLECLEDLGLYCEAFEATPNWVHFQIAPPKSGKRFFKP